MALVRVRFIERQDRSRVAEYLGSGEGSQSRGTGGVGQMSLHDVELVLGNVLVVRSGRIPYQAVSSDDTSQRRTRRRRASRSSRPDCSSARRVRGTLDALPIRDWSGSQAAPGLDWLQTMGELTACGETAIDAGVTDRAVDVGHRDRARPQGAAANVDFARRRRYGRCATARSGAFEFYWNRAEAAWRPRRRSSRRCRRRSWRSYSSRRCAGFTRSAWRVVCSLRTRTPAGCAETATRWASQPLRAAARLRDWLPASSTPRTQETTRRRSMPRCTASRDSKPASNGADHARERRSQGRVRSSDRNPSCRHRIEHEKRSRLDRE